MTPTSPLVSIWPCLLQKSKRHQSNLRQLPAIKLTYLHLCTYTSHPPSATWWTERNIFILRKTGIISLLDFSGMLLYPSLPLFFLHPISMRSWHWLQSSGPPPHSTHILSFFSWRKFHEASVLNISMSSLPTHSCVSGSPNFISLKLHLTIWLITFFLLHSMCILHCVSYLISLQFSTIVHSKHFLSLISYSSYPLNYGIIQFFLCLGPCFSYLSPWLAPNPEHLFLVSFYCK